MIDRKENNESSRCVFNYASWLVMYIQDESGDVRP